MKRSIFLSLMIIGLCGLQLSAQGLRSGTFSAWSVNGRNATATGGEAIIASAGFIEALLAGAIQITDPENPTSIESMQKDIQLHIHGNILNVRSNEPYSLLIYHISGVQEANNPPCENHTVSLKQGVHIVILQNKESIQKYKIQILN